MQTVKNLLIKAIEQVEKAAFETDIIVEEPGEAVEANWAVTVGDPFDQADDRDIKSLVAFRLGSEIPPNGVHFEVISPARERPPAGPDHVERPAYGADYNPTDLSPKEFTNLQRKREQDALLREGRINGDGKFRTPPAPQYGPRRGKTIDEEIEESSTKELTDEDTENLDRSRRLGKDD